MTDGLKVFLSAISVSEKERGLAQRQEKETPEGYFCSPRSCDRVRWGTLPDGVLRQWPCVQGVAMTLSQP